MARIEFLIPVDYEGKFEGYCSLEIENAPFQPRVGEFVRVEGYREVLKVEHYYGVPISNGRDDTYKFCHEHSMSCYTGAYMTLYVTLGPSIKDRE